MGATQLGKILLFCNLVLSLGIAAVAVGIYTNHVDFPGAQPVPGEKVAGEFGKNKAVIDDLLKAAGTALARWESATKQVERLEQRGPQNLARYASELDKLEGKDKNGNLAAAPIQTYSTSAKGGTAILDDDGIPVLEAKPPRQPLPSRKAAYDELASLDKEIASSMAKVNDQITKEKENTVEINGVPGMRKGLRDLLAEERNAQKNAREEMEYLRPLRYNRQVESDLLLIRQVALRSRLAELKKLGMASR